MNAIHRIAGRVVQLMQRRHCSVDTYARSANEIFDKVRDIQANADKLEPSKLLAVERVKTSFLRPYWEKDVLRILGLESSKNDRKTNQRKKFRALVVVKNTPQMCRLLWKVKHLVRVKPVTFPDGLPTPGVYTGTHLDRFGVFRKDASFEVDPQRLLVKDKFERVKWQGLEIAKPMHLRWMNSIK